jgi:hypothetical protein
VIFDGEEFRPVAIRGEADFAEYWRQHPVRVPPGGGHDPGAGLVGGLQLVDLPDVREGNAYREIPEYRCLIDLSGARTMLIVPLRKTGRYLAPSPHFDRRCLPSRTS